MTRWRKRWLSDRSGWWMERRAGPFWLLANKRPAYYAESPGVWEWTVCIEQDDPASVFLESIAAEGTAPTLSSAQRRAERRARVMAGRVVRDLGGEA